LTTSRKRRSPEREAARAKRIEKTLENRKKRAKGEIVEKELYIPKELTSATGAFGKAFKKALKK